MQRTRDKDDDREGSPVLSYCPYAHKHRGLAESRSQEFNLSAWVTGVQVREPFITSCLPNAHCQETEVKSAART